MARGSKNKVFVMGNLTADVELVGENKNVASFTVVSDESYKDKNNNQIVEEKEFHQCVAFGNTAKYLSKWARKGSLVDVEGKLSTRKWQDKQGNDRYSTQIKVRELQIIDGWRENADQNQKPSTQADGIPDMSMPDSQASNSTPAYKD